jgi:peptide/nickel transport system substrate-binding protein
VGPKDSRGGARRLLAILLVLTALAAACGGDDDDEGAGEPTGEESDQSEQGDPVSGGSITVGLEAETPGWQPGSGNFANSGVAVAYAIYDPLVRLDENGEIRPYLAESIEANADFTEWTVKLRPDVKFHDDMPLNS